MVKRRSEGIESNVGYGAAKRVNLFEDETFELRPELSGRAAENWCPGSSLSPRGECGCSDQTLCVCAVISSKASSPWKQEYNDLGTGDVLSRGEQYMKAFERYKLSTYMELLRKLCG